MGKDKETKEKILYLLHLFNKEMGKRGYKVMVFNDKWQPRMEAIKEGYYRIRAIGFLDPSSPGFITEGAIGTDVRNVFYFSINPPFEALDQRFENMMREMEPFISKKIEQETLKIEF